MLSPAVSVIVTAYNYGRFVGGALRSVLAQTFPDFELLVIDDGSTDDTAGVVRPFLADPRVSYHRTDHVGQPRAKNLGIRRSRGRLVAFLDADDLWLPRKLERQVALFRADPGLGVVYTRRRLIDEAGWELEHCQVPLPRGDVLATLFQTNFICFSSVLLNRAALDDVGLFDEGLALAIDYDLWLRLAPRYRFDFVDEPLVLYRTGHASLSRRGVERVETVMGIMRRFLDERGGRALVPPGIVRRSWADTYSSLAHVSRPYSRWRSLCCLLRALWLCPGHPVAWRALASVPFSEAGWQRLRHLVGRRGNGYWHRRRADVRQPVV